MREDGIFVKYSNKISFIVNTIRLFGEDFKDDKIVENILLTIPKRFQYEISFRKESKDLSTISVEELINVLQEHEQIRAFKQNNVTEGVFYTQNRKEKDYYPLFKYCKRKMHLKNFVGENLMQYVEL